VEWTKSSIAKRGQKLDISYDITWSCYRESAPACGTCDACAFWLKDFQEIGVRDPIEYEQRSRYVATVND